MEAKIIFSPGNAPFCESCEYKGVRRGDLGEWGGYFDDTRPLVSYCRAGVRGSLFVPLSAIRIDHEKLKVEREKNCPHF